MDSKQILIALAKIIHVMVQHSDGRKLCCLEHQSLLWFALGLRSLSSLLQFLGRAWCFAATVAENLQVANLMETPYKSCRLESMF